MKKIKSIEEYDLAMYEAKEENDIPRQKELEEMLVNEVLDLVKRHK